MSVKTQSYLSDPSSFSDYKLLAFWGNLYYILINQSIKSILPCILDSFMTDFVFGFLIFIVKYAMHAKQSARFGVAHDRCKRNIKKI